MPPLQHSMSPVRAAPPLWLAALSVAVVTGAARGGTLYTIDDITDRLRRIDTETLRINDVGPLGTNVEFGGLAYDADADTLYLVDGRSEGALYTVDRSTGRATLVGRHGVEDLFGLEVVDGVLYGSVFPVANAALYRLDTDNGRATRVGRLEVGLGGLAYDVRRDMLVGMNDGDGRLFVVDPDTAELTVLSGAVSTNDSGLAYDSEKDLLWDLDYNGILRTFGAADDYEARTVLQAETLLSHASLAYVPAAIVIPLPTYGAFALAMAGLAAARFSRGRAVVRRRRSAVAEASTPVAAAGTAMR